MSIEIVHTNASELRALLLFAAKKDIRTYLEGVCFDIENRCMVTTNGHALLAIKAQYEATSASVTRFIIPRVDCERAIKLTTKKRPQIVISLSHVQASEGPRLIELTTCEGQVNTREIDGRYPDWTRVVATKASGEFAKYDPDLVAAMCDAMTLVTGKRIVTPHIAFNGNSSALVACDDSRVLGVLMPWRCESDAETLEQWRFNALCNFGFLRPFDKQEQKAA